MTNRVTGHEDTMNDYLSYQQSYGLYPDIDVNMDVSYVVSEYLEFLMDRILPYNRYRPGFKQPPITYYNLLQKLYDIPFYPKMDDDEHRYSDGISLRSRYAIVTNLREEEEELLLSYYDCSMLEMMVALALKIEEHIMADPAYGNRTGQWFWYMIRSLGLNFYHDSNYKDEEVYNIIRKYSNGEYEPNGMGGLFYIPQIDEDLRKKSIWYQTMRYLDTQV